MARRDSLCVHAKSLSLIACLFVRLSVSHQPDKERNTSHDADRWIQHCRDTGVSHRIRHDSVRAKGHMGRFPTHQSLDCPPLTDVSPLGRGKHESMMTNRPLHQSPLLDCESTRFSKARYRPRCSAVGDTVHAGLVISKPSASCTQRYVPANGALSIRAPGSL